MKVGDRFNPYRMFTGAFVPNWLLRREELSLGAKLVYARLAQFAGEKGRAFPRVETLAAEVGLSDRQTQRYLSELKDKGLIEITEHTKEMKTSDYFFTVHEWFLDSLRVEPEGTLVTDPSPGPVTDPSPPLVTHLSPLRRESGRRESEEENQRAGERSSQPSPKIFSGEKVVVASPLKEERNCAADDLKTRTSRTCSLIETTKAKARATAQAQVDKAKAKEQKIKNLSGTGTPVAPSRRKQLARLEAIWMRGVQELFPGVVFATWGAKERGQVLNLVDKYSCEIVEHALEYLVRRWDKIQERFLKSRGGVPGLGFLLKLHEVLVPEAQRWAGVSQVKDEWDRWFRDHPGELYAPAELEKRYQAARKDLEALGCA